MKELLYIRFFLSRITTLRPLSGLVTTIFGLAASTFNCCTSFLEKMAEKILCGLKPKTYLKARDCKLFFRSELSVLQKDVFSVKLLYSSSNLRK